MEYDVLNRINHPNDIKEIDPSEYKKLAKEIRHFLVTKISRTGGHLSSNLGTVELTMALHLFLDFPKDKLVWDVGHQSYTHKILTGRKEGFDSLRQFGGMSGFPKRKESPCDSFETGHSSTSISAALGMVMARELSGGDEKIVAVIGDGALSGGMAYEALNNAARLKSNLIIILNDNHMSISENVGGMANYLGRIRTNSGYQNLKDDVEEALKKVPHVGDAIVEKIRRSKDSLKRLFIPGMLFEDMGLTYIGPIDGHHIKDIQNALDSAHKLKKAVLIHVVTEKGRGYKKAEECPSDYHGVDPFFVSTGKPKNPVTDASYTDVFKDALVSIGRENEKVVAISAAMPSGTGLIPFKEQFPERFYDVGIAEQHAVTFAAGMAAMGYHPVVAVYSTFFQRAYDQILHDVCIQKLPVIFAVDRAGLVGKDGETHQGIFDLSYFSIIPDMTVMAPKNAWELKEMLRFAVDFNGPVAIRYPRGKAYDGLTDSVAPIEYGRCEVIRNGAGVLLLAVGRMVEKAVDVAELLKEDGIYPTIVNIRFVKPVDYEHLTPLLLSHHRIVTMEDNIYNGGFGEQIGAYLETNHIAAEFCPIALPCQFIEHGDIPSLEKKYGLSPDAIAEKIRRAGK